MTDAGNPGRRKTRRRLRLLAALGAALMALQGCTAAGMAVGAGASAGLATAQERSLGDAARDAAIQVTINHKLFQADLNLFGNVGVTAVEGRVLLTGSVPATENADRAVRLAWQADNVREIINEIQIATGGGIVDAARDRWITTQLRSKVLFDRNISGINYSFTTVNGVVYIMGIARDQAELKGVTAHARTLAHVKKVISHVWLRDDPRRHSKARKGR